MPGTMQRADVAEITPEVIAQEALTMLAANLPLASNVTKEAELVGVDKIVSVSKGDVVNVPKTGVITANNKAEGGDVVIQNPGMDKATISINQHWEATIAPEDYAQAVADRNIQDTYLGDMILALAEKIESTIAGHFDDFTIADIDATGATSTTIEDYILAARKALTKNRAPLLGRFGYWDGGAVNLMLKNDRFTRVEDYGANTSIQDGELGKIHGFRNFESIFVPATNDSPVQYKNALMHRRALCLAMRPLPVPRGGGVKASVIVDQATGLAMRVLYSYNANKLADQMTLDVLFGVGALRPELGVIIKTV